MGCGDSLQTRRKIVSLKLNAMIIFFCVFALCLCGNLFAEDSVQEDTAPSFSLYHRVSVDASLSYKFTNNQGATISSKTLEPGTTNDVGSFYATFNTTRKISIELVWTPLLREGETVASADTTYPYTMTISNQSGTVLPNYASQSAGTAARKTEFVVYGDFGSGEAFFINKKLNKKTTGMFEDSLICSMSISIETNDTILPGTYTGSIFFVTLGN